VTVASEGANQEAIGSALDKAGNTASASVYDAASRQYSVNWRTAKAWKGTCRLLTVSLDDGSTHSAIVMFR
jgi:hypothetical protein